MKGRLTQEQRDAIVTRARAGEPYGDIALDYRVTEEYVSQLARKSGYRRRPVVSLRGEDGQDNYSVWSDLSPETYDVMRGYIDEQRITIAYFVRVAIHEYLERHAGLVIDPRYRWHLE